MSLTHDKHREELRAAGWHTRGYLPHFDGRALPQFITLHLADAIPKEVLARWKLDLRNVHDNSLTLALRRRVEKFVDKGYGNCFLRDPGIATIVQDALLHWHQIRYQLFAWVIMPNHSHFLLKRFECCDLRQIIQTHKSFTAHHANALLGRTGPFWMEDYFDRYIRDARHFQSVVKYIESNPVKAGLCAQASDWPFGSAYFRSAGGSPASGGK
jgi:REP element-mobilizing transposase RayT